MPVSPANERGWGHPDEPGFSRQIVGIDVDNVTYRVHRNVAALFKDFLTRLYKENNYSFDEVKDDWSYINRDIRGRPGVKSNHSWGLAVDVNATKNPMADQLITDLPVEWIRRVAPDYLIRWGGDYTGRKDAMHFEFVGTVADAARITYRLRNKVGEFAMTPEEKQYFDTKFNLLFHELRQLKATVVAVDRNEANRDKAEAEAVRNSLK